MSRFNRVFVIVIDSMGIGNAPDAAKFDDEGADTLGHISDEVGTFLIPNLTKLGLANLLKYSLIVVSTIPVMVLYPFIQKHFVTGVMVGSVKG